MPNKTSAIEWLTKAYHNLNGAKILYDANHYTDTIAIELHYGIEKILKSFLAFQNNKIYKTHNLIEIYAHISDFIKFESDELVLLKDISDYHIKESYPQFDRTLPPRKEIKEVLDFADELFNRVCDILDVDKKEVMV